MAISGDAFGGRVAALCRAFDQVFEVPHELRLKSRFNNANLRAYGTCDGIKGVQWNTWFFKDTKTVFAGVNLEGKVYDGVPVAHFITRELKDPELFDARARVLRPEGIEIVLAREVWQGPGRLRVPENKIGVTPIDLMRITREQWRAALKEARGCLRLTDRGYRGVDQIVTISDGTKKVTRQVTPQVQVRVQLTGLGNSWVEALKEARTRLEPMHAFLTRRSAA